MKFSDLFSVVITTLVSAAYTTGLISCSNSSRNQVSALSNQNNVFIIRTDGTREDLPVKEQTILLVGEGIDVNETGSAILQFADLLKVEVLRDGELTVSQLDVDEQNAAITIFQNGGLLLNKFDAEAEIDKRFTINTEFASVTAVGTTFMVVKEPNSPLEWVLALDAAPNDLEVTSNATGVTNDVQTDSVRWVAPIGDPSANIQADMGNVQSWLQGSQDGTNSENFGDIVWAPADVMADTAQLQVPTIAPAPGVSYRFQDVLITLGTEGQYWQEDCNLDGIPDVAMQGGSVAMDFREVLARVRALDVTVLVRSGGAWLTVFDPARQEIQMVSAPAWAAQAQVLSARHVVPYHYAELRLDEGCFLGFVLPPPNSDGTPADTQPSVEQLEVIEDGATLTPSPSAFRRPPENGEFLAALALDAISIDGSREDWFVVARASGVSPTLIEAIVWDQACSIFNAYGIPSFDAQTDLLGEVMFAYDLEYLYALFVVYDESFAPYEGGDTYVFQGDAPQLIFDTDLLGDFDDTVVSKDDIEFDLHPGYAIESGDDVGSLYGTEGEYAAFWNLGDFLQIGAEASRFAKEVIVASEFTFDGYIVEAAIPWASLNIPGRVLVGEVFGVAASISDNDRPETNVQECMISSAPGRSFRDPTTWGTLFLMALP